MRLPLFTHSVLTISSSFFSFSHFEQSLSMLIDTVPTYPAGSETPDFGVEGDDALAFVHALSFDNLELLFQLLTGYMSDKNSKPPHAA